MFKKEFFSVVKFFLVGLFVIGASFAMYHLTCPKILTTEQMLNPKAACWLVPDFFRVTFFLGFAVWLIPVYGVLQKIRKSRYN